MGTRSSSQQSSHRREQLLRQAHFFKELADIFLLMEGQPVNFTMAQHLLHILRKKGNLTDPYQWDDDQLIRKISAYNRELKDQYLGGPGTEEPIINE